MDAHCFVSDIYIPKMLYAITIRSPVAKGKLLSIDCPKLPDDYRLVTAADIHGKNCLDNSNHPIFAKDQLSYIGEPVALLLGPDKNILENLSRECIVNTEEEKPVFSINEADDNMIAVKREIKIGNPEASFENAASVIRSSYTTGIQEHWYAEPSGSIVWMDQKTLIVRTHTQWPYHVRRSVAQMLGIPVSSVKVIPTITVQHLDGRLWYPSLLSCQAALGAWLTKKPVRLLLTRGEDFHYSPKRCGTEINISSAHNEKGEITGMEIDSVVNFGAYTVNENEIMDAVNLGTLGVYNNKKVKINCIALKTNIPPQGPFAGFGFSQGFFAIERHVSYIAEQFRQDPAQWRKENFVHTGFIPPGLPVKDSVPGGILIDTAIKMSDYNRKWASYEMIRNSYKKEKGDKLRGIGIACAYHGNDLLYSGNDNKNYGIEVTMEKNGSVEIKTSMVNSGTDYEKIWGHIVNENLDVHSKMIHIICNTDDAPDSGPSTGSRNITIITKLLEQACKAIKKQKQNKPLPITVRKFAKPQKSELWDELLIHQDNMILDSSGFIRPGWASAVVEVIIDPVGYVPAIRGVWMCVDGGKIISEANALSSLKISTMQAIGWAYREQINYIDGVIPAKQFDNFDIPSQLEIPPINIEFINSDTSEPKGIGDLPFSCIPAAYIQAVSQAVNCHFRYIPVKTHDILHEGRKA